MLLVKWHNLRKTGCGGGAAEMPQSAALPHLHTRRGNHVIRDNKLEKPDSVDTGMIK